MLNYFLPVSGLTFMSMLGFWIDAEAAPARVSLAVIRCVDECTAAATPIQASERSHTHTRPPLVQRALAARSLAV
jgi:hypothetical protein